jgi:meso-butanediol dehydrogenase/(S,S)-butanediol dehydrogenase/diacetyl reductase
VEEAVEAVRVVGGSIDAQSGIDLADPTACECWIGWAGGITGKIDILYNNASAARFGTIDTMSFDDWKRTFRNELDLVFWPPKTLGLR